MNWFSSEADYCELHRPIIICETERQRLYLPPLRKRALVLVQIAHRQPQQNAAGNTVIRPSDSFTVPLPG